MSPHPTSSEPVQASEPGSDPKQEQYVVSSEKHASSVSDTEQLSSVEVQTPTFKQGDQISLRSTSLGTGLYGEVLEVDYKGETYAAKEYRTGFIIISAEELKTIFAEKLIGLRHSNVVPYYGVCNIMGTGRYVVVMEKLRTNLASFVDTATNKEKQEIEPQRKLSILRDVAKGLEHLHSQNPIIVHCDLKPCNVLLNAELTAKIADCGNSYVKPILKIKEVRRDDRSYLDYLPPEAIDGEEFNDRLDVFSFGHLSLYLIIQCEPRPLPTIYKSNGIRKARSELERRQKYIDEATGSANILHPLLGFSQQCLHDEAGKRPPITKFNCIFSKTSDAGHV